MDARALAEVIRSEAHTLGFDLCRFAAVREAPHADFFDAWVQEGRSGAMEYLARNRDKRRFPVRLGPPQTPFRTVIVLAVNYHQFALPPAVRDDPARGVIAAYAWGHDYHEIIRPLLHRLDGFIRSHSGRTALGKALVDSGPVLERDWAQAAGLGFLGKNCCIIHPRLGSRLLLATLLIPESLPPDFLPARDEAIPTRAILDGLPPDSHLGAWQIPLQQGGTATGTCGRCTRCLDACPTDAFVGPLSLDPRRCISYWTIETDAPIPIHLRAAFGNRIFGCDICQDVCPWNARLAPATPRLQGLAALEERIAPPLLEGFSPDSPYWLDEETFTQRFRRSPLKRAGRAGMVRNVCVALGNWGDAQAIPALTAALHDVAAPARGHAAWALGRVGRRHPGAEVGPRLVAHLALEDDPWVRAEIAGALGE